MLFKTALIEKSTMYQTWDKLHALCHPLMKDFETDLLLDKPTIVDAQSPFIHWTRELGTALEPLIAPDQYPAKGVTVGYLFGTADREHILTKRCGTGQYYLKPFASTIAACHYYDGKSCKRITLQDAHELLRDYAEQVRRCWANPRLFDRRDTLTAASKNLAHSA